MRPIAFSSLRVRLATQYAGVFAVALLCLASVLFFTTDRIATSVAARQLASTGAVYDRLWSEKTQQLQQAAGLLAKDFGFRAAVATGDQDTASSALKNLRRRLGLDTAFIVGIDGNALVGSNLPTASQAQELWYAFDDGRLSGVARIGKRPMQVVAAPITAPNLLGWIVFAVDLDQAQMTSLEELSPVPITAGVVARRDGGSWTRISGHFADLDESDRNLLTKQGTGTDLGGLVTWHNDTFAVMKPLPSLSDSGEAALLLLYPKSRAIAAFRPIQWSIVLFALLGLLLVIIASWRTAARITRPVAELDDAARRLAEGQRLELRVEGTDELARLSLRFNDMASQIEERERRIRQLAFDDALTGLPNRVMFLEHAGLMLSRASDGAHRFALICIDLDGFKNINDTLGHAAGDKLLRVIADRLRQHADGKFIARLGGDEFVVLGTYGNGIHEIEREAMRLQAEIGRLLNIEGHDVVPGASIGIAIAGADGEDIETLLRNADLALQRAKEDGRNGCCFFEESFNERAQTRRQTETELRRAIERAEFELYYQPLFDLKKNRICAFEALIRWNHPERGLVSPVEFIPIAEETGMIGDIGAWAMRQACRDAANWPEDVRVAVNVSSVQFQRPGLNEIVLQALATGGLSPARLEIEITESIFLEDAEATLRLLHGLRSLGVRIALDDFGTGYSSLSYLQSFPFDKIKIDRSFIQALAERPDAVAVVRAITELASALGMETTAEGVEDSEQLERIKAHGCTSVQGFLFSKPVTADKVHGLLAPSGKKHSSGRKVA